MASDVDEVSIDVTSTTPDDVHAVISVEDTVIDVKVMSKDHVTAGGSHVTGNIVWFLTCIFLLVTWPRPLLPLVLLLCTIHQGYVLSDHVTSGTSVDVIIRTPKYVCDNVL